MLVPLLLHLTIPTPPPPPFRVFLPVPSQDSLDTFFDKREGEANPFVVPNEDVFVLRAREREENARLREENLRTKIWDKKTNDSEAISISQIRETRAKGRSGGAAGAKQSEHAFQGRRRNLENMTDFIAKKREMFLIQMSLDTKKAEIQKLDEKARLREDTLRAAERMLEEDAMRFDAFLKENDRRAHLAIRRAELETKDKQDKTLQVKRLKAEVERVEHEIQKADAQLKSCKKYKEFLDARTPPEHLEAALREQEAPFPFWFYMATAHL